MQERSTKELKVACLHICALQKKLFLLPGQQMKARPARPGSIERGNKTPDTDTRLDRGRRPPGKLLKGPQTLKVSALIFLVKVMELQLQSHGAPSTSPECVSGVSLPSFTQSGFGFHAASTPTECRCESERV